MHWKDSPNHYGFISRFNHWFGALIVIIMLSLGLYFSSLPDGDAQDYWAGWHVSLGGLFFIYLLFRVFWRVLIRSPDAYEQPQPFKLLSKIVHGILLTCIAIMAISGPLIILSKGYDINVFGWFSIPSPFNRDIHDLHEIAEEVHEITANVLWVTLIIHVLAAVKHLITKKGDVMRRMLRNTPEFKSGD